MEKKNSLDKKLSRMLLSGTSLCFILLLSFIAVTFFLKEYLVAAAELFACLMAFGFYRVISKRRSEDIRKYVEDLAFQIDDASKMSLVNFPLPIAIINAENSEIMWNNGNFNKMMGISSKQDYLFESRLSDMIQGFDTKWLLENRTEYNKDVDIGNKKYSVLGNMVSSGKKDGTSLLATVFFVDNTESNELRTAMTKSRVTVAIIVIDSYEELYKGMNEAEKSNMTAEIDKRITAWAQPTGGIIRKLDRDRYLFVFRQEDYVALSAKKFSILDDMRSLENSEGVAATVSIGIGRGDLPFGELYRYAGMGIDMALSRGGDQVVIKNEKNYDFFGGKSKQTEKRTKVKVRITANALRQLIRDSSNVFIMGHKISDLDCIGAAAGMCAAVRACGKKAFIITDENKSSAGELIAELKKQPAYEDAFVSENDAIVACDPKSLCIVVDTCNPAIIESPELLETAQRTALIDHHRKPANFIENCDITLHETYASSTSEFVAELLQYMVKDREILKTEAEALLAGIVLDSKGFTVRTGTRTFEAAAFLKRLGADMMTVKRMFSGDLETHMKKYRIISGAKEIFPGFSLAVCEQSVDRAVAASAADELMNIIDMKAAFVVYGEGEGCSVSARSNEEVNVQVIMEKLGGGGSLNMAGAQFATLKPSEVEPRIIGAVEEYIMETETEEQNKEDKI